MWKQKQEIKVKMKHYFRVIFDFKYIELRLIIFVTFWIMYMNLGELKCHSSC